MDKPPTTILLVEDNQLLAESTSDILADAGYEVLRVDNGDEAIDFLRHTQVDIIISDIVMPGGLSGLELVHQVSLLYPVIRILLVTGFGPSLSIPSDLKRRILYKPFGADALLDAVQRLHQEGASKIE
ncbi:MAG TPA: response regulator [Terriglobia bacterium]|nr:response regulator [Terriglobia bacterium]